MRNIAKIGLVSLAVLLTGCAPNCTLENMQSMPERAPTHRVNFDSDSARLNSHGMKVIREAAREAKECHCVLVVGHTDDSDTQAYNILLAERRAKCVRNALIEMGVPESNIVMNAAGERQFGHRHSRKERNVEITIYK